MPEGHGFTMTPLRRLTARLVAHDWAWARDDAGMIARNWERRRAQRPEMFDGIVLLACGCTVEEGVCTVALFEARFSQFLALRDAGLPETGVDNAFSAIVPVSADGAVLLGEMGAHTANAGQIYFPCGTPDRDDVRAGGEVDLAGSAARELLEETGLALPAQDAEAEWLLLRGEGQFAFLRPVAFDATAEALRERIEGHCRGEAAPELARIVVARSRADIDPERMPGFARAYLERKFPA